MPCALTSARARDSGDMRARSSENFMVIAEPFASQLRRVFTMVPISAAEYNAINILSALRARAATPLS